jgi:hypothetical protein
MKYLDSLKGASSNGQPTGATRNFGAKPKRSRAKSTTKPVQQKGTTGKKTRSNDPPQSEKDTWTGFIPKDVAQAVVDELLEIKAQVNASNGVTPVQDWEKRLGSWMMGLYSGFNKDARTFLFRKMSYGQLKTMITNIIKERPKELARLYSQFPEFVEQYVELQESQIEKFGSKSLTQPWPVWGPDKVKAVWRVGKPSAELKQVWEAYLAALDDVEHLIAPESLRPGTPSDYWPRDLRDVAEDRRLINSDTNSCDPSYVHGWYHPNWAVTRPSRNQKEVQIQIVDETMAIYRKSRTVRDWRELLPYLHHLAAANIRTVAKGNDPKLVYKGKQCANPRLTVAMDKKDTTLGKSFQSVILDALLEVRITVKGFEYSPFCANSTPERIDVNMQHALELAEKEGLNVLSTDYSGFDAHLSDWLMWDVAQRMAKWFLPKDRNLFLAVIYSMIYQTAIITPDGIIPEGPSRMKSGTMFTNMLDSLCNYLTQRFGMHLGKWDILMQFVQGDDGLLLGPGCTPENFDFVSSLLGLEANAAKQYYKHGSLAFLQKMHVVHYPGGIYPIARAFNACLSLEDDVKIELDRSEHDKFPWAVTYRTCARLDNAWADPNFKRVALIVAKDDKLHLGKDYPAQYIARMAGSYAMKWAEEWKLKPWKAPGGVLTAWDKRPINRVLRGDNPPPPGKKLFEWGYGVPYEEVRA